MILILVVIPSMVSAEPAGRWRKARHAADHLDAFASLGYLSGYRAADFVCGVTVHDPGAYPGLNFYTSGHGPEALLMDMEGKILHRWYLPTTEVWPDAPMRHKSEAHFWRKARLLADGGILAIVDGIGIIRLDKNSRLIWATKCGAHHDADIGPNGEICTLTRMRQRGLLIDCVSVLSAGGEKLFKLSIAECLERSEYAALWNPPSHEDADVFHANSIRWMGTRHVIVSLRNVSAVIIIDLEQEVVTRAYLGEFRGQHDAQVLESGNILMFDNRWEEGQVLSEESAGLELDGRTGDIVWEYRPGPELYSASCGSVQRLPNGNTFIVESDNGRAIEVTPEEEIVWEYRSPHRAGPDGTLVATLFDSRRVSDSPILRARLAGLDESSDRPSE
jgi:hypothetical protein